MQEKAFLMRAGLRLLRLDLLFIEDPFVLMMSYLFFL